MLMEAETIKTPDFNIRHTNETYQINRDVTNFIDPQNSANEKSIKDASEKAEIGTIHPKPMSTCSSTVTSCKLQTLKGFEFCHKHILEDTTSPYQYCSYVFREDKRRCSNPAPKLGDQKSLCLYHEKQKTKIKKIKAKKIDQQDVKPKKNQNSITQASKADRRQSSSDEEYSFFTDSFQVDKIDCTWLGNQASDADSTDSEDENPLNHAGTWTLEECVKICKEKMERLRFLYMQQFKRLSYSLREDRRKMLNEYDMDPYTISKVGVPEKSEDPYRDFVEDVHLSNYQKMDGVELLAEKQMKEKKNHSYHGKRSELPRCHSSVDGLRCTSRALPFSKYCHQHICQDQEQYLFVQCTHKDKQQSKCLFPADLFHGHCRFHTVLETSKVQRFMKGIDVSKKAKETKKRKLELSKSEKKDVEKKADIVYHNTRRASKNREENLRSPSSATSSAGSPKVQLLDDMKPSPTEVLNKVKGNLQKHCENEQPKDINETRQIDFQDSNAILIENEAKIKEEDPIGLLPSHESTDVSKSVEEVTEVSVI